MTNCDHYPPGRFCWHELATTNLAQAKSFYGDVFGWRTSETPTGDEAMGPYTMAHLDDRDVCGMYTLMAEQLQFGIPPHWMPYVAVEDAEQTAARAKELGATVHVQPMQVMDIGKMAVLESPTGEAFSVWQALRPEANGVRDLPGSVSWNELMSKDVDASRRFYSELFGWELNDTPMVGMDGKPFTYTILQDGEEQLGGMMQMGPEFGPIPSHWMVYFQVADVDATVATITERGGTVRVPPMDIPVGRFSVVSDPAGASFSVIKLNAPQGG